MKTNNPIQSRLTIGLSILHGLHGRVRSFVANTIAPYIERATRSLEERAKHVNGTLSNTPSVLHSGYAPTDHRMATMHLTPALKSATERALGKLERTALRDKTTAQHFQGKPLSRHTFNCTPAVRARATQFIDEYLLLGSEFRTITPVQPCKSARLRNWRLPNEVVDIMYESFDDLRSKNSSVTATILHAFVTYRIWSINKRREPHLPPLTAPSLTTIRKLIRCGDANRSSSSHYFH